MSKRRAERQINPRDSDEEDEPESPGVFEVAPDEILARRTIRKAKRTLPSVGNDTATRTPFAGFSFYGNGKTTSASSATSMTTSSVTASNGNRTSDEYLSKVAKLNRDILDCIKRLMDNGAYLNLTPCFEDYMKHFQRLTREEEDRQRKNNNNNGTASHNSPLSSGNSIPDIAPPPKQTSVEAPKHLFSFSSPTASETSMFGGNSTTSALLKFQAPKSTTSENNSNKPEFQFAKPVEPARKFPSNDSTDGDSASKIATSSPSFFAKQSPPSSSPAAGAATPKFTFGVLPSPASSAFQSTMFGQPAAGSNSQSANDNNNNNDDDEDQQPKIDIAPVDEEGSLYTKKVKLYYKKQQADDKGAFAEKGVGFLHVKPLDNGGHQLLVRAQTTLGNVLLNIRIGKDLPVSRMKNNNVAISCVPNPPLNPQCKDNTPTMFLIRVKSKEDAAELYDKLVEFKGAV